MENLLLYQSDLNDAAGHPDPGIEVLEWGSGGSTVYFPKFLRENDIPFSWTSIEYNREWYEKVKEATKDEPRVDVVLFDSGNTNMKQRNNPMDEYVKYPSTLNMKWDLILVDGRKRRRCLHEATQLLSYTGVVVLHDAQREYYHCAFDAFKWGEFQSTKLWEGRMYVPPKE